MTVRAVPRRVAAALAAILLATAFAAAQVPVEPAPSPPPEPQEPQEPTRVRQRPGDLPGSWRNNRVPDELDSQWTDLPRTPFEGFPVFPSRLSGYGTYPRTGAADAPGDAPRLPFPLLPLAAPEPPDWPAWARLRDRAPLPYAADLALLVQHSDRVWWRLRDTDAFVPLYFHDKLRTLGAGAEVQVRQSGEFELLLHASTRLVAQGPTDLRLGAMSATAVEIDVRRFTRLRLQATGREHVVRLPDGSQLQFAVANAETEVVGPVILLLTRADEPDRYGGRADLYNAGDRAVTWQHAFGVSRLEPGERLWLFLRTPAATIGPGLLAEGTRATEDGAARRFEGGAGAQVAWCGARFSVGGGASLVLDPLQGEPFAEQGSLGGAGPR